MKILFVANYKEGVGGISGQVAALQQHLREEGHTADIFSTMGTAVARLVLPLRIKSILRNYDIIHIHCCSNWGFLPAVIGVLSAKKMKKRAVLTYHGGGAQNFFKRHKRLVKYVLLRTDKNIVLSGFLGKVFDKYLIPYTIIPNIIDFDCSLYRKRPLLHPNFICIRSHEKIYNIPCILRAFKILQEKVPDAKLTLVGDGSLHAYLKQLVSEMRLNNVAFTGRVDNSFIYDYLNQADIMVSSPTVDNMPVSLLEAMNAGLLVISSNVGGVPYIVRDSENGLLFKTDDEVALAQKMLWALDNQKDALTIVDAAHKDVMNYNWMSIRTKLLSAYSE